MFTQIQRVPPIDHEVRAEKEVEVSNNEVIRRQPSEGGFPKKGSDLVKPVLRVPKVWILLLLIRRVMIALVTAIYIGSGANPVDHTSQPLSWWSMRTSVPPLPRVT